MDPLAAIRDWPVDRVAAAAIHGDETVAVHGPLDHVFALASVSKLVTAVAVLVAHEEQTLDLDSEITDEGATAADLLAHAGGISPDLRKPIARVRRRRIYSTSAYAIVADAVADSAAIAFPDYAREAVCAPLGMSATTVGSEPGSDGRSTVADLTKLVTAWRTPVLLATETLERATSPHLPDLDGVLPGFGQQSPNPWGLGPEIKGHKQPHWTGTDNAPSTYGHFGRTGTMLWIDPVADRSLVVLTDEPFGRWAAEAWPRLSDAVLA